MNKAVKVKNIKISLINTTKQRLSDGWLKAADILIKRALFKGGVTTAEISLVIVNQPKIKELNKRYRHHHQVTDVLSFTYNKKPLLGEIIICLPYAQSQARVEGVSLLVQLNRLAVHGIFHLLGFDHQTIKEWRRMNKLEKLVLS